MTDRRAHPRYSVEPDYDDFGFDESLALEPADVSESGVFLRTTEPDPVGAIVDVRFPLALDDYVMIEGVGEVVHVHKGPDGEPVGMGVRFLELDPGSEDALRRYIEERAGEPLVAWG